mgnify:CR=1 FL=1
MPEFKKMDLVWARNAGHDQMGVVLMGPMEIPYFHDGCASALAFKPLDITNPAEWESTFTGYLVYVLVEEKYQVFAHHNMKLVEADPQEGYIPFDNGTARLRVAFGMVKLAYQWWGKKDDEMKPITINFSGDGMPTFDT